MSTVIKWTNKSVLAFAGHGDPVEIMEARARTAVLGAMDAGWEGPPFDPVTLAELLRIPTQPRSDIPDARTVPTGTGLTIEFNPLRPRGRMRFSLAHEIAHSFFPDCAEQIRNRGGTHAAGPDDWQLEILCNIGAAELLMPAGSFQELANSDLDIDQLLESRKKYDVSTEALLIRTAKLTPRSCAAFCASFDSSQGAYRIDYVIPSRNWRLPLRSGVFLPKDSLVADANAIGFTAKGNEVWPPDLLLRVEAVALAPYPGTVVPRIVGIVAKSGDGSPQTPDIEFVTGDALEPRGGGRMIIAHVVPDDTFNWGGGGFASALRKRFPEVAAEFKATVEKGPVGARLGTVCRCKIDKSIHVAHMVAQRGHGRDPTMRIRYSALSECLTELAKWARELDASVHMPKIGTGHGGGEWTVIRELISELLVRKGIKVTVYQLPK